MSAGHKADIPVIGVDEALEVVLGAVSPLPPATVPLEDSAGRFLAEEIRASVDMPPFDRSAMDGYALRSADAGKAPVDLEVIEEIAAGHDATRPVGAGQASRIMTGAAIPQGADAVVMVEATQELESGRRVRLLEPAAPGQHVRRRGEDLRKGAALLQKGAWLAAPEIALLAAEGRGRVLTGGLPGVAILSTGDELVGVEAPITGSLIRETNSWSLLVLLRRMGIEPRRLGIVKDERKALREKVAEGLGADVLILTGGVSMGEYDLVGEVLRDAGCMPLFERVAIQPGKPLFFGVLAGESGPGRLKAVFGLPGNPVSSIVDFLVFARPALRAMMGAGTPVEPMPSAEISEPIRRRPGRRGYIPARVEISESGSLLARPLPSMGSADLVALSRANALVVVPESAGALERGARLPVFLMDDPFGR